MKRKSAVDDFMKLKLISDPQPSPDGMSIAYCVKRVVGEKNIYRSSIWSVSYKGGIPRCMTAEEFSCSNPRWSPDGKFIAFLSDRQKPKDQIYLLPVDGGEASALTNLEEEGSISGLRWSPDGSHIAFLYRKTPEQWTEKAKKERTEKGISSPVRLHKKLNYRMDCAGYTDDEYPQIWVADVKTGETRQLTVGDASCQMPVWMNDSDALAFLSDRRDDRDITASRPSLYLISLANSEMTEIPSPPGSKDNLALSPDGSYFAYIGNPDPDNGWGARNNEVLRLPVSGGGNASDLTGRFDIEAGYSTLGDSQVVGCTEPIQWSKDGSRILFPVSQHGDTRLCSLKSDGSEEIQYLTPAEAALGDYTRMPDSDSIVCTLGSAQQTLSLNMCKPAGSIRLLSDVNVDLFSELSVSTPESPAIPRKDGGAVPGWLMRPPDFDPSKLYPLVLYVHGGPHAQYGNVFFHELQLLAAEGYVVLYTNPRGSKGYGEAHTTSIRGRWGTVDFEDIMAAADYAATLPYVDTHRMAIMGGSYGGYMTVWTIGHTDRFRCAIADRMVSNLPSMSGTCDFTWRPDSYFKGDGFRDSESLWLQSPLAYAGNVVTPLLIIHSDGDLRCPAGQAEEFFSALRLQGKEVEYLRYPSETSHGLSRMGPPDMRLHRLMSNLEWLDRWLKKE